MQCCAHACVPACAEVVPARLRTFIYAFDRSFEMAVAACAAPVVAKLAESYFGFDVSPASLSCQLRSPLRAHDFWDVAMCQSIVQQEIHMSCFMSTKCEGALQGTATTSGDIAHDLSKANALSNALAVMCGELC